MTASLFTPCRLGALALRNRIVLAPMTRCRAGPGNVPTALMARYYAQRATAGLLVTEGSQIAPEGQGYVRTPGCHDADQREGWRLVTRAVHRAGGVIVLQLWHVGRASHPAFQPGGVAPVAPSAVRIERARVRLPDGSREPFPIPRALALGEISALVTRYRDAARGALDAGFDGVELHAANGYLLEQFLYDGSNRRNDRYGGSIAGRSALLLEVIDAVIGECGPGRVGVRLSPRGVYNDMRDSDRTALYGWLAAALDSRSLAYVHLVDPRPGHRMLGPDDIVGANPVPAFRARYRGPIVVNGGYDAPTAETAIASGDAAVSFGIPFIANADLPERLRNGAPLDPPDPSTFYEGEERGYTEHPIRTTPDVR